MNNEHKNKKDSKAKQLGKKFIRKSRILRASSMVIFIVSIIGVISVLYWTYFNQYYGAQLGSGLAPEAKEILIALPPEERSATYSKMIDASMEKFRTNADNALYYEERMVQEISVRIGAIIVALYLAQTLISFAKKQVEESRKYNLLGTVLIIYGDGEKFNHLISTSLAGQFNATEQESVNLQDLISVLKGKQT